MSLPPSDPHDGPGVHERGALVRAARHRRRVRRLRRSRRVTAFATLAVLSVGVAVVASRSSSVSRVVVMVGGDRGTSKLPAR